jgi:hypothetical protein
MDGAQIAAGARWSYVYDGRPYKRPVIPGSGSNLDRRDPDLIHLLKI